MERGGEGMEAGDDGSSVCAPLLLPAAPLKLLCVPAGGQSERGSSMTSPRRESGGGGERKGKGAQRRGGAKSFKIKAVLCSGSGTLPWLRQASQPKVFFIHSV